MTLSEAIEAVEVLLGGYANGGSTADQMYIGRLAGMLATYPKAVAQACCHPTRGLARECKFLPTVADIAHWCDGYCLVLESRLQQNVQRQEQIAEREEFDHTLRRRQRRLSLAELKEKYGDWREGWKPPGTQARQLEEAARNELIALVGEEAFNQIQERRSRES